jgi:haloacid dehalogenase-like hydrolase
MNERKQATSAIVYDFDGTLARGNIQERTFLPELGLDPTAFWDRVGAEARKHDSDEILVYMLHMLEEARAKSLPLTAERLERHGKETELFPGVATWFQRINAHAAERGLAVEHYVISSGIREMIDGCPIRHHLRAVYASHFIYDANGEAVWPGVAINYTTKTQYLFRINKGIHNNWDKESINRWTPMDERPVPFSRMIFLGDGATDVPSMKMIRHQGGYSIGVFDPQKPETPESTFQLIAEDRVNFVAPADYREGRQLDVTVKGILGRIASGAARLTGSPS